MKFSKQVSSLEQRKEINEKLREIGQIVVRPPSVLNALANMEECMESGGIFPEPDCMMLSGDTGLGKTTIIQTFLREFPRVEHPTGIEIPVFTSIVPKPATIKGVIEKLLLGLGAFRPERGSRSGNEKQLYSLLSQCKVRLIILDEFQQLLSNGKVHNTREVSDWIKTLINETKIPMVLCGMPDAVHVLNCNDQLSRRFPVRNALQPFTWWDDCEAFVAMLRLIDKNLPFRQPSGLAEKVMPMKLMAASQGTFGGLMRLLRSASKFALIDGAACISETHLRDAHSQRGKEVSAVFEMSERELERLLEAREREAA